MTTETTPAGAMPVAEGATPSQTPPPTGEPPAPSGTPETSTSDALGEAGKRALEEERKARRDAEKRASGAEAELKKRDEAALSEQERSSKRLAELEREKADWELERQELRLSREVERTAARLGFADPADAIRLVDGAAVTTEDGSPTNVEALLKDLAKSKPYLLAKSSAPGPGSGDLGLSGGQTGPGRTYTREELRDSAFFKANRDDILAAQREGRVKG